MRKIQNLILTFIGWCCSLSIFAQEFTYNGLKYSIMVEGNKTVEVVGHSNAQGEIVIPDRVPYNDNQYDVVSIGNGAFKDCAGLTSVKCGNVIQIRDKAFSNCTNLTSIDLKNVTYIGKYSFSECSGLISIDLGNVESIDDYAFQRCRRDLRMIAPIEVPYMGYQRYEDIYNVLVPASSKASYAKDMGWRQMHLLAYDFCINGIYYLINSLSERTVLYAGERIAPSGDFVIPNTIEYKGKTFKINGIGDYAFSNCDKLTSFDFKNVSSVGKGAFYDCSGLSSLYLMEGTTVGDDAFMGCSGLTSIDLENFASIGDGGFGYCSGLTSIDLGNVTSIGNSTFIGCKGLTSIDFGNVSSIGDYAFDGCNGLTSIDFKNVTSVGERAFYGCTGLNSIDFSNVISIGVNAFSECYKLTSVDLKKVSFIGNGAFYDCNNLRVKVPNEVPVLGNKTFNNKTIFFVPQSSFRSYENQWGWNRKDLFAYDFCCNDDFYLINSESNVTYVGYFTKRPSGDIIIPKMIEYNGQNFVINRIGDRAFSNFYGLTSINFQNVTSIGTEAFESCSQLTSLDLKNVNSIGEDAFRDCRALEFIDFGNVSFINDYAFYGCSALTFIDFGNVTSIGDGAFMYCGNLTSVDLKNVTSIGELAFEGCSNLKKVKAPIKMPRTDSYKFPFSSNPIVFIPRAGKFSYVDSQWKNNTTLEIYDICDSKNFYIILSNENATVSISNLWEDKKSEKVIVPGQVQWQNTNYTITEIGQSCYQDNQTIVTFDSNKVKAIRNAALKGCARLDTLILNHVSTIEADAFKNCSNLKIININTEVPPVIEAESAFDKFVYLESKLYVPIGSKKVYEEAPYWRNFFNIVESDKLTGIVKIIDNKVDAGNIYKLDGRLVKSQATRLESLQPDVYIIRGKKIIIK